jgi:TRAP-type transport system small permease protein
MLDKFLDLYCSLLGKLIALLLAIMVVMVFGNVVLRKFFDSGITASEELSRWMFVWLTFLGAIIAVRENAHLGTDFLIGRLPVNGQKFCLVLGYGLMLYMCWMMFKGSYDQTIINWQTVAPATGLSEAWFYGIGMVFAASSAVVMMQGLYKLITGQIKDDELVNIRESEEEAITYEVKPQNDASVSGAKK